MDGEEEEQGVCVVKRTGIGAYTHLGLQFMRILWILKHFHKLEKQSSSVFSGIPLRGQRQDDR